MSKQDATQPSKLPRPTNTDEEAWKTYWQQQGQPWRTEPEIDAERQTYLIERLSIEPNIEKGIYPFKDIKLSRADVEWLLATHENGRGPINWSDKSQREREGLDLRGADLSQENLSNLPLACIQGGPGWGEWFFATEEQRTMAVVNLQGADLRRAQLQGAGLRGAQLQGAFLGEVQLQGANLSEAQVQKANLRGAQLQKADLAKAQLQKADLRGAQLQGAFLGEAQLREADLHGTKLQKAMLIGAQLQGASLYEAQLQGADLREAQLDGVQLPGATLSDEKYGPTLLADIRWGEINLAVVDWTPVKRLGDEHRAHQTKDVDDYRAAVRANRQLAVVLRDQGLNEEADRFAYRAQKLQRIVLRRQALEPHVSLRHRLEKLTSYIFSLFLDLLAGYGYHPIKTLGWYLLVIGGFAMTYSLSGHLPLLPDAFVFSIMSFHGRGFFPSLSGETSLHNSLVVSAAAEAVIGLFIEISFFATFTQRFFGR